MREFPLNRRQILKTLGLTAGTSMLKLPALAKDCPAASGIGFTYSLNMSTIRGQKLGFVKELEIAAKAGFASVEIWMDTFQTYLHRGGSTAEAKRIIDGLGVVVENAIGFAEWIVDDHAARKAGLAQMQEEMDLLAKIGCKRIAAPPAGANAAGARLIDLNQVTERYLTILTMGKQAGVIPLLEMWGASPNLKKISQVLYVVAESGHMDARVLLDSFHIFKGGSTVDSAAFVGKTALDIIHINDYPAGIPPAEITEPDRIYPGDGIAPLRQLLQNIKYPDKPLIVSLEVFNETYYRQDALLVAQTGLAKMKAVTAGL